MAQKEDGWQLDASAPELYERYLVPSITRLWAADLVKRAAPKPGERVLDVACGTGIVARLAAAAMGTGHVVGLDINEGMLAVARSRSAGLGLYIEWHEASALDVPFPDSSFDLVLCQLGLQFFPDRTGATRNDQGFSAEWPPSIERFHCDRAHTGHQRVGRRLGSIPRSRGVGS
jgi:ubiquinone/menaquinone biosynthesis C-methylase UbiE